MITKNLKNTDLNISSLALGTAGMGKKYDESLSKSFLDFYCEQGGNLIDTALVYASKAGSEFMSEKIIGRWMKERKNRDQIVLETKGGHPFGWINSQKRCTGKHLLEDIERSLINLQTEYIDVYWIHKDDETVPVEELMEALRTIVEAGKARYVGISNWKKERLDEAVRYMKSTGGPEIVASQILYSIAQINEENRFDKEGVVMTQEEYEYYSRSDLTVFAYASQAHGFFAKYEGDGNLPESLQSEYLNDYNIHLYKRLKKVAFDYDRTISEIAIAALVQRNDFEVVPVISFSREEQLKETVRGMELKLSAETLNYIFSENIQ